MADQTLLQLYASGSGELTGDPGDANYIPIWSGTTTKVIKGNKFALTNHNHSGTYAPALSNDDNYVTDAQKAAIANLPTTIATVNTSNYLKGDGTWSLPPGGTVDATSVMAALDGAAIPDAGTPATDDKVLIQDSNASNALKYVNVSDLPGGTGGGDALTTDGLDQFASTTTAEFISVISDANTSNYLKGDGTWASPDSGGLTESVTALLAINALGTERIQLTNGNGFNQYITLNELTAYVSANINAWLTE